ncbi:MAG: hypothetical protein H0T46_02815 [Deltaproteobacteria bacterium]|nr:hypothetical protein [Deltaproteobacteria bacterium]
MKLLLVALLVTAACVTESDPDDAVAQEIESSPAFGDGDNFPPEEELARLVLQYCGMTRDGVTTYKGLTGTYQRLGLTGSTEPVRLKLLATQDNPDARGTFTGTYRTANGSTAPYAGRFAAIPDNPAIGAAFVLDTNSDGENDKLYFVLAIRRSFGQVRGLCLAGAEHPFLMSRTYF